MNGKKTALLKGAYTRFSVDISKIVHTPFILEFGGEEGAGKVGEGRGEEGRGLGVKIFNQKFALFCNNVLNVMSIFFDLTTFLYLAPPPPSPPPPLPPISSAV